MCVGVATASIRRNASGLRCALHHGIPTSSSIRPSAFPSHRCDVFPTSTQGMRSQYMFLSFNLRPHTSTYTYKPHLLLSCRNAADLRQCDRGTAPLLGWTGIRANDVPAETSVATGKEVEFCSLEERQDCSFEQAGPLVACAYLSLCEYNCKAAAVLTWASHRAKKPLTHHQHRCRLRTALIT